MRAIEKEENTHTKKKALAALVGAVVTLSAATSGFAYQHATGGGAATAVAQAPPASGFIVVDWNKELLHIIGTKAQPATVHPTRSVAIMHAAMYDAVDSITHSNPPYLFALNAPAGARPDVAAAEAGHDTLAALYPSQTGTLDRQLAGELESRGADVVLLPSSDVRSMCVTTAQSRQAFER
jgi:hypothetical protein